MTYIERDNIREEMEEGKKKKHINMREQGCVGI